MASWRQRTPGGWQNFTHSSNLIIELNMIPYSALPRDKRDLLAGHSNILLIAILNLDNWTIRADED